MTDVVNQKFCQQNEIIIYTVFLVCANAITPKVTPIVISTIEAPKARWIYIKSELK